MKRLMLLATLALAPALAPVAAHADVKAADACAASLTPNGKMIYEATKPNIKPGAKIADEIRSAARPLVMGGKLSRSDAQAAAEPAAKCLQLING